MFFFIRSGIIMDNEFTQFDPVQCIQDIPDGLSACVNAPRRSGKTVLVTDLVKHFQKKRNYREAYLFSGTALVSEEQYAFIPDNNKYDHLDLDKMEAILSDQQKVKSKAVATGKNYEEVRDKNRVLIICDDVINEKNARNASVFGKLFTQGRHHWLDVICISQTLKGFSPMARTNSDLVITWRSLRFEDRECVMEDYMMIEDDKKSELKKRAVEAINAICCEKYQAMIICQYKSSYARHMHEYIHTYIADPNAKPKRIGQGTFKKKKFQSNYNTNIIEKKGKKEITKNVDINVNYSFNKSKRKKVRLDELD